jgi:hypothetical protein
VSVWHVAMKVYLVHIRQIEGPDCVCSFGIQGSESLGQNYGMRVEGISRPCRRIALSHIPPEDASKLGLLTD